MDLLYLGTVLLMSQCSDKLLAAESNAPALTNCWSAHVSLVQPQSDYMLRRTAADFWDALMMPCRKSSILKRPKVTFRL